MLDRIETAIAAIAAGQVVIVVDDERRENEGDFVVGAEFVTTDTMALFLQHTSGFVCVSVEQSRADQLGLPLMVSNNTELFRTAFAVTVDAIGVTSTGISAADRAATIRALAEPTTQPEDLARPGHVHVLRAQPGGVRARPGHTEAGVELARLAGLAPAAAICEVVTADKRGMARLPELMDLAKTLAMPVVSIGDLVEYLERLSDGSEQSRHQSLHTDANNPIARRA